MDKSNLVKTSTETSTPSIVNTKSSDEVALEQQGYLMGRKIGKGSFAKVVSAHYCDRANKKIHLACKIVNKQSAPSDFLLKFFPRELDIITKISHPNIIQLHSILQRGSKIFIFMRYAERGDLLDYIMETGMVGEEQAKKWFSQMAKALVYLNSIKIVHRDLKCENVLLSKRLNVKLTDFGFARYYDDGVGSMSETYCGSSSYTAPEVIMGVPYDPKKSDVWSLGVVLFIMLNASMPFDDFDLNLLLEKQKSKMYNFCKRISNVISLECKTLLGKLLEPEIKERWSLEQVENCDWLKNRKPSVSSSHD